MVSHASRAADTGLKDFRDVAGTGADRVDAGF
jgi:hypothetical protein